jgi:hypothetical protein
MRRDLPGAGLAPVPEEEPPDPAEVRRIQMVSDRPQTGVERERTRVLRARPIQKMMASLCRVTEAEKVARMEAVGKVAPVPEPELEAVALMKPCPMISHPGTRPGSIPVGRECG